MSILLYKNKKNKVCECERIMRDWKDKLFEEDNRYQKVRKEIDKLLDELAKTEVKKDTTMTREKLVSMIFMLSSTEEKFKHKAGDDIG